MTNHRPYRAGNTPIAGTPLQRRLLPAFRLCRERAADVCVIGGGYTGLSTALHLRKRAIDVVLLEAERVGWGASGRNGGHVGTGQRADQSSIEKWVGMEAAQGLWQLGLDAVQRVCDLIDEYQIDCELGSGNLHLAAKPSHADELQEELEHLESQYGYQQLSYLAPDEVSRAHQRARILRALYWTPVADTCTRSNMPSGWRAPPSRGRRQNL
jgi:glycine/D-amino acid oxidase-like deaminating enzyme